MELNGDSLVRHICRLSSTTALITLADLVCPLPPNAPKYAIDVTDIPLEKLEPYLVKENKQ